MDSSSAQNPSPPSSMPSEFQEQNASQISDEQHS